MAVQTTTITTPAPVAAAAPTERSWAMIVKGAEAALGESTPEATTEAADDAQPQPQQKQPVRPGPKGSAQAECLCRGKLLVMLGYYGWILPLDDIDHPDAQKNGGRIYVRKRDFPWGASPIEGDIVEFYLYADSQGLGAERCRIEGRGGLSGAAGGSGGGGADSKFVFSAAAAEFVPAFARFSFGAESDDDASTDSDESDEDFAFNPWFAAPAPEQPAALEAPPGLAASRDSYNPPVLRAPPGLDAPPGLRLFSRPWASSKAASRESSQDGSTSADGSYSADDTRCDGSSRSTSPAAAKDAEATDVPGTPPWRRGAPWRRAAEVAA